MRAAVLTGHGGPDVLAVRSDVPVPEPGPRQVVVEVVAAAVNMTDVWSREGAYGTADDPDAVAGWRGVPLDVPRIQGGDMAGRVVATGGDVPGGRRGERVLVDPALYADDGADERIEGVLGSERDGGFAEYVVVDADRAHDVSDSPLADEQLACLPIAYGTAMGMLERAALTAGETLCVTGASGGVGLALVQLAAARGARVVAVTSEGRQDAVRAAGASAVVLRSVDDVAGAVRDAAGSPVDCVADVVGGAMVTALLGTLRTGGRAVVAGAVAGPVVTLDLRQLYLHQRRLIGSTMHTAAHFDRLVGLARTGAVHPVVAARYPLEQIAEAQARLRGASFAGKLVIVP